MLLIRDLTAGGAYHGFAPIEEGYQEAYRFIKKVEDQGHVAGGEDVKKVLDYMEGNPHLRLDTTPKGWLF